MAFGPEESKNIKMHWRASDLKKFFPTAVLV